MRNISSIGLPALVIVAGLFPLACGKRESSDVETRVAAIHERVTKVDAHVDVLLPSTPERYYAPGHTSRSDVAKLDAGKMNAIALAVAVGSGPRTPEGIAAARAEADEKLEAIRAFVAAHPDRTEHARSVADIERIRQAGKIAILTSFLNARSIGSNLAAIDTFYQHGVRIFGMVHAGNNDFADSSRPIGEPAVEHGGLSALGREAVARLNALGVIIDVSQLTVDGVLQTTQLSKVPVIASHSGVRSIVDRVRNLSDREIDAIGANRGVIHVGAFNAYLVPVPPDLPGKVRELRARYGISPDFPPPYEFGANADSIPPDKRLTFEDELAALYPKATVSTYVDHIEYIVKRIGIDHVGIGSDFNHGAGFTGFNNESEAPNITRELVRRGYTEDQIAKIWGGNFLRVFREVEALAASTAR